MGCLEYRTISLISHVMKLMSRIVLNRNSDRFEEEIRDSQSGFRPHKGTREGIFDIPTIIERYPEALKPVYICFIDCEKAFDRVFLFRIQLNSLKDMIQP